VDTGTGGLTDPDAVPGVPEVPVTQPGDLWVLGRHRLLCGDSTVATDVERLAEGETIGLCFTSPPYKEQRDYDAPLPPWQQLMCDVFAIAPIAESGQIFVNLGMVHEDGEWLPYWDGWIQFMRDAEWRRFGWYVWDQGSGLPGDWNGRLAPSHEYIFHFNRASRRPTKTVETKMGGQMKTGNGLRKADGVVGKWTHAGRLYQPTKILDSVIRINRHSTLVEAVDHPAVFPVALAEEFVQAYSMPGDAVYEPFLGSGSTLIACEKSGRACYGMEISPAYCDVIVNRWQDFTGQRAVRHG
jgi:DNA modification methylase